MRKTAEQGSPFGPASRRRSTKSTVTAPTALHLRQGDRGGSDDDAADADAPARRFLTGPQVLARYGVSDMCLFRWLRDKKVGFPQPDMVVNGRRFWTEEVLEKWESTQLPGRKSQAKTQAAE